MTSNRPYLIRALYEWIADNGLTPHLLVNAELAGVDVPAQYVHEGRIVLNIGAAAVQSLRLGNDLLEFSARFGGAPLWIHLPPLAVMAIYARENGQGMVFGEEPQEPEQPEGDEPSPRTQPARRPRLKVVK